MTPVHPGRILKRELEARGLSADKLALALRVPSGRITGILNAKSGISPETALRLVRYFGNSPQFWMNLQACFDLAVAERDPGERVEAEVIINAPLYNYSNSTRTISWNGPAPSRPGDWSPRPDATATCPPKIMSTARPSRDSGMSRCRTRRSMRPRPRTSLSP